MAAPLKTRPYDGPSDADLPDAVKKLPAKAKEIWVAAFNSAWDGYDPDTSQQDSQEGYAAAVAWGAVNKTYKQQDGKWVPRSFVLSSFEAPLTHVRAEGDRIIWATTCSDDGVDKYATRMTTDLHEDILRNVQTRGMPYLTIAHFNQLARIGVATELWRDGRRLKASGHFFDARDTDDQLIIDLSAAASKSALEDMNLPPRERAIRTSIGFKPSKGGVQTEDLGVIAYVRGWLPEISMTTHPGNSRVDFSSTERSGDMKFRISPEFMEEDAATIVGESLAKKLRDRLEDIPGRSADEDPVELIYRSGDFAERATVPSHKGRTKEDGKWDGPAATKRARTFSSKDGSGEAEDMDWTKYRGFHAVYDPENAETFGAYGFIHHDTDDQGQFVDLRGVLAAGAMSRGARGGKENPDAQKHLGPHYKQFDRTPPWQRSAERLIDRLEEINDAQVLELGQETVDGLKARLSIDLAQRNIKDFEGVEITFCDGDTITVRSRFPDDELPLIHEETVERIGRKLQGKRLDQLAGIGNQLSEAASGIADLVEWARAENKGEKEEGERSLGSFDVKAFLAHAQKVAPDADFEKALVARFGGVEADDSLIETMEQHSMMEVAFEAAMTLTDIVVANMAADLEAPLEDRMQNVEKALTEYGQVIGSMLVSAFGGGRSAPPPNDGDQPESDPENVNRAGDGTGAVNADNGSQGQPDLAGLDATIAKVRQLVIDGASVEEVQAALIEEAQAIEAARREQGQDDQPLDGEETVARVAQLEMDMSQMAEGIRELLERSERQDPENPPPPRSYGPPRRRSLPAGPPPAEPRKPQPRQTGRSRLGQAERLTISEAVEQSMGEQPVY